MTTTDLNTKLAELESLIENLQAELDACPNRLWLSEGNMARHTLLIVYVAKRDALLAESGDRFVAQPMPAESNPVEFADSAEASDDEPTTGDWTEEDAYGQPYPSEGFSTEDNVTMGHQDIESYSTRPEPYELFRAFSDADQAWSDELHRQFGKDPGDVRYMAKGEGKPGTALNVAYKAFRATNDAWLASVRTS